MGDAAAVARGLRHGPKTGTNGGGRSGEEEEDEEEGPWLLWRGKVTLLHASLAPPPPPPPPFTCCLCLEVAAAEKVGTILGIRGAAALGGVVEEEVRQEVEVEAEE